MIQVECKWLSFFYW